MRHLVVKRRQMERRDDGPHGLLLEENKAGIELRLVGGGRQRREELALARSWESWKSWGGSGSWVCGKLEW